MVSGKPFEYDTTWLTFFVGREEKLLVYALNDSNCNANVNDCPSPFWWQSNTNVQLCFFNPLPVAGFWPFGATSGAPKAQNTGLSFAYQAPIRARHLYLGSLLSFSQMDILSWDSDKKKAVLCLLKQG